MHARRRLTVTSLILIVAACGSEPEVEVRTHVGDPIEPDPMMVQEAREAVLGQVWPGVRSMPEVAAVPTDALGETKAPPQASALVASPPANAEELEAAVAAIREGELEEVAMPARNLAAADPSVWPHVRELLLRERTHRKSDHKRMLALIGGDVPNRYGHFDLHWKQSHGYRVKVSDDWFEDLLLLPLAKIGGPMRPVYRELVLDTALLRAAGHIGHESPELTGEVVTALIDAGYVHHGTYRDEVGRALAAVGDGAVPHLMRATVPPDPLPKEDEEARLEERKAEYALHVLDATDRLHPPRAIEALRDDPPVLTALLEAYGIARRGEAAGYLLDFFDAPGPEVRAAARNAFLSYVVGPPPRAKKKKLRLLGGGTKEGRGALDYRQLATISIRERLEKDAPELLEEEPPCDIHLPDGTTDQSCIEQPMRLTRAYIDWLDARRVAHEEAVIGGALVAEDREAAIDHLDTLLVMGTTRDYGPTLAPVFVEGAERAVARRDFPRAAQLLRKSARLVDATDPSRGEQLRAAALRYESAAPGLSPQGRAMLLHAAFDLRPEDPELRAALAEHEAEARAAQPVPTTPLFEGLGLVALGLLIAGAAGVPIRRRIYGERA